jgi:putative ABC transport system substrate-binding protein
MHFHQVKRREFIKLLGGATAWPFAAHAQQPTIPVFGILLVFSRDAGRTFTEPLRTYMQALGYVEGRNITFDVRYADGKVERLPTLAAELVAQRPAVIATFGDATGLAAKAATTTIPIVSMSEDLVRAKIVTNMRQPGGNITGLSIMGTELDAKRLEILAELLPPRSVVLLLADPTTHRESRPSLDATAAALGLTLREATVGSPEQIERSLREARNGGAAGVNVLSSALLFALRGRIISLAAELGLPAIYQWPETADEGGRSDRVRTKSTWCFPSGDDAGRQDSEGSPTRRHPGRAAYALFFGHQSQDCERTWSHRSPPDAASRRSCRRVMHVLTNKAME